MSYQSNWANGGWLVICDVCGRKFKEDRLRMRWDGLMTCPGDWEVRQPQDFVRGVADIQAPPYVRPEQANDFIPINFTQYPEDSVEVSDYITKGFTTRFGGIPLKSNDAINGAYLNKYVIDGTSPLGYVDPEQFTFTEEVLFVLGRNFSDTLTAPTESLAKSFTKVISDTVSIGETVALVEVERYVEDLSLAESIQISSTHGIIETVSVAESVSTILVLGASRMINGSAINVLGLD